MAKTKVQAYLSDKAMKCIKVKSDKIQKQGIETSDSVIINAIVERAKGSVSGDDLNKLIDRIDSDESIRFVGQVSNLLKTLIKRSK
jgi:hypothetical protein